jgi:hypothetical protein
MGKLSGGKKEEKRKSFSLCRAFPFSVRQNSLAGFRRKKKVRVEALNQKSWIFAHRGRPEAIPSSFHPNEPFFSALLSGPAYNVNTIHLFSPSFFNIFPSDSLSVSELG